ncbi:cytochrome c peroxidase [soil metagenome]
MGRPRLNRAGRGGFLKIVVCLILVLIGRVVAQETEEMAPKLDAAQHKALADWLRVEYAQPAADWPKAEIDEGRPREEIGALDWKPTGTKEEHRLGLSLFFDPRLSKSQGVSCASCHEPQLGWSNGVAYAFGEYREQLTRHPPTLVGVSLQKKLFWDGRADTLEQQAHDVILNPVEMNGDPKEVVSRLEKEKGYYGPLFEKAFGDATITFERILSALAAFERAIPAGRTKFDRFAKGDVNALTDTELVGLNLFRTKARCMNCHQGPMFTDGDFHNVGLTYYGRRLQDLGRYKQTGKAEDVGKFRTATLRNVGRTAPYMHNGVFPSLEGLLRLYNAGMPHPKPKDGQKDDPLFPVTSVHLKPLGLTPQELADLRDFLLALNEPPSRVLIPPVPPIHKVEAANDLPVKGQDNLATPATDAGPAMASEE